MIYTDIFLQYFINIKPRPKSLRTYSNPALSPIFRVSDNLLLLSVGEHPYAYGYAQIVFGLAKLGSLLTLYN